MTCCPICKRQLDDFETKIWEEYISDLSTPLNEITKWLHEYFCEGESVMDRVSLGELEARRMIKKINCPHLIWDGGHSYFCKKSKRWISLKTCLKRKKGVGINES